MKIICVILAMSLIGCSHPAEVSKRESFNLPNGVPVECYRVDYGSAIHYVYVVKGKNSTTANWDTKRQSGKNTITDHHTAATIEE